MVSFFPNQQTFLYINIGGGIDIRWYAVLILTGALVTYLVSKKEFLKAKYVDRDFFDSLIVYSLWFGIIGARLWFCAFFNFSFYLSHPLEIIKIWDGGLAIQGGLFFGVIFAYIYSRKNKYPFLKILDIILPNVLIGQAFGRWGNFINQECHGGEVASTYFDGVLFFLKKGMYIDGHYYEPLFFYESLLCIIGWLIIYFVLRKRQNKRGDLAYCYLMWYGIIRFFIEGRRTDSLYLGNIKMAQLTSIVFLIIGLLGYLGIIRKKIKSEKPTIIFDFDGTLVDTSKSIIGAYEECFKKYSKIELFTNEVRNEVIGPALKDMFAKYFPDYDFDTVVATYRTEQSKIAEKTNVPIDNAIEVLSKLHEHGYRVGIVSNRIKDGVADILKKLNMYDYVDDICGFDEVKNGKPNPEGIQIIIDRNKWNRDVIVIGDSKMDIMSGNNYGAYTIAYVNNLERSNLSDIANEAITDLNDLLNIVEKDIDFTYNKL